MGDRGLETKPEEHYPLLKVDGGGDSPPTQTVLTPVWGVQCSKKSTWVSRWPECMSACWMTMILFGISFMVFYALGMGACRRQQFVFVKCNTSRPASNVFYHHLVPRGVQVPFLRHSEYLASIAIQYPNLHFHVYFLIDDGANSPRQNRFISKLIPLVPYRSYSSKLDENSQEALVEFQKKYQNINVTIIPLSKYMSGTPLRFKWRTIPTSYLPFYARVFSVWENGGLGIDLALHSASDDSLVSRRKSTILQQHNDGINPETYASALNRHNKEEDTAIFDMLFGLMNHFLNETRSFINRTLTFTPPPEPKPNSLVRVNRAKREVSIDNNSDKDTPHPDISNSSANIVELNNESNPLLDLPQAPHDLLKNVFRSSLNSTTNTKLNKTNGSQVVLIYDFQIISDNIGPSYLISEPLILPELGPKVVKSRAGKEVKRSTESHLLSLDPEGTFIAASSRLHPFLGQLISAGCQRMSPKFAIQDALLTQCSDMLREDVYCNNIYIL